MAAPELRLEVSLGLNTFRSQMRQLVTIAQSEFTAQLNIRFNRRRLDDELNNLRRAIARRTYRIEIGGNLDTAPDKISTLQARLKELEGTKIDIPITGIASITKKEARSLRAELRRQILSEGGKIKIPVVAEVQTTRGGAGGGFASSAQGPAGLFEYMRTQGLSGGNVRGAAQMSRSALFEKTITEASFKDLQRMLRIADVAGRSGLKTKSAMQDALRQLNEQAQEAILGNLQMRMRDAPQGPNRSFLDKVARAVFWMAGVDPEYLRQQAAQRRTLPAINFEATHPRSYSSIGPSSTGRALPFGAIPGALPGSAFAQQKRLIGNRLDLELKEILRGAANTFVDSVRAELNAAVRSVSVRDLGNVTRAALSPQRIAGLLPSGVGRVPNVYASAGGEDRSQLFARRTAEAYARSALRGVDVMAEGRGGGPSRPYSYAYRSPRPQGAITPYERGAITRVGAVEQTTPQLGVEQTTPQLGAERIGQIREFVTAFRGIEPLLKQTRIPLAGAISELAGEFGFAVQQVLLFGTAYKALAFFTNLPAQALEASKQLQSFNNQLLAITGTASNVKRSTDFINETVSTFNVPLQSAREGFLRLYASMQPAGMDAGVIENLFVGISQASATLGLSADQVDRVTYAFSQMASKGKVMSEEVTGQLGDVIPGALSLMADAAGMSMADFKKAMEDGLVSGKAMEQLFTNLPIVLEQRFGKGAAGAAQTLQGQLSNLTTETTRLYEAFNPIVTVIAETVLPILSSALKDAQDAVEAFGLKINGINPAVGNLSEGAQNLYKAFEILVSTAQSVATIIESLSGIFNILGTTLSVVLQTINAVIGNPIGEFFVKLAVNIGVATAALNLFAKAGIAGTVSQLIVMIRNLDLSIASLRVLITTSRAAKIAVGGIVAGGIILAIEGLATSIANAERQTNKLKDAALGAADALKQMSFQQLRGEEANVQKMIRNIERLQAAAGGGISLTRPTQEQIATAKELGLPLTGGRGRGGQMSIDLTRAEGLRQQLIERLPVIRGEMKSRFETPATAATITPIELSAQEEKSKKGRSKSMDELIGGKIERDMRRALAALGPDVQTRLGVVGEDERARRMVEYYGQYRKIAIELYAIQQTIKVVERDRALLVANGLDPEEKLLNLKAKQTELVYELQEVSIKQYNASKKANKEEEEQYGKFKRDLEDIRIKNGLIPEEQAKQIKLAREYEDIVSRYPFLTDEQKEALRSAIYSQQEQLGPLGERIEELRKELEKLRNTQEMIKGSAEAIGDSFAQSFKDTISGAQTAQQALASFFQRIGDYFLDMVAQMIGAWLQMQAIKGIQTILGAIIPGMGGGAASLIQGVNVPVSQMPAGMAFANGGIAPGGFIPFRKFATGGTVSGPTLGLVGEGRYNEAVVPLPDGKSIPVDLGNAAGNQIVSNITVNVNNGQTQSNATGANSSELGRKLEGAVKQVIVGELRPGGLLSR